MLDVIPENRREEARQALAAAFGLDRMQDVRPVVGGASGALTYRVEAGGRAYLMRLEPPRDVMRDPDRGYACMRIAAEAGVAPPVRHLDPASRVAIVDFIEARPIGAFPGGPAALARAQGELIARLQATEVFPPLRDYPDLLAGMLAYLKTCGRYRPELFGPHEAALAQIREAYPWDPAALVSSHNDPNPGNFIFDGARLWLVDWETAFRNDPLADIAILVDHPAVAPDQAQVLVEAWLGRAPNAALQARLTLMRLMTRLYYGALMLSVGAAAHDPADDLSAMSPAELEAAAAAGRLKVGPLETLVTVGKSVLARFLTGLSEPGVDKALAIARAG
ncbi:phosphotransferase [Phenylobacterium sp.]|jgi:Ser/Thr protein kinase RdoA (MazF antagonist)|uniref:phosphotransferase n=1 Tax=Phenylobacterium sp. TaxID=1871053 RepID=UPI002E3663E6|nr:phosphotransferase [Phenylobacterium sp.]HEX2558984.1 phosphotransferase [Phenylobacterium sp.]